MRLSGISIFLLTVFFFVTAVPVSCSGDGEREARQKVEKGRAFAEESRFHDALAEFGSALHILDDRNIESPDLRMKAYNGLGGISYIFGDTLSAIAYYAKAWEYGKNLDDNLAKARLASNLAMAYNSIGKTDSARIYNDSLHELSYKTADFPDYQYYFNLGRIEYASGQWNQSVQALDSALTVMCRDYPSGRENSEIYILLAKDYMELGNSDLALENAELGDVNAEFESNDNNKLRAFSNLESIYRKLGKTVKADAYADRILELKEAIVSHNRLLETRISAGTDNTGTDNGVGKATAIAVTLCATLTMLVLGWWTATKRKSKERDEVERPASGNGKNDVMERLDQIMKTTKAFKNSDFDISELSRLAGINTKYISKAINATGRNFRTFMAEYRVEHAIRLLTDSETMGKYTIESVGREVGFKSHSNFIAAFRKIKGTTPSAYLRNLKG